MLLPDFLIFLHKRFGKFQVNVLTRLAHMLQGSVRNMLRSDLQLAAYMVPAQFVQKLLFVFRQQVVVTDTGTDEHLLHPRQSPQLPQQPDVIAVVRVQIGTGFWEQALPVLAGPELQLLLAGGMPEIGRRPAYVIDVSLKIRKLCHFPGFFKNRLMAPGLYDPPLMGVDGAERTAPETAPAADDAELYFFQGRNAPLFVIHGMPLPGVGQIVDRVHFFFR